MIVTDIGFKYQILPNQSAYTQSILDRVNTHNLDSSLLDCNKEKL